MTRYQYDDAGNVVKVTDPLGHQTTFDYTDSWVNPNCAPAGSGKAYATRTTDHLGRQVNSTYYSCTGFRASTTDPNGQTTTFTYDIMDRPDVTQFPDGGGIDIDHNDAQRWTLTKTLRGPGEYVSQFTYFDALGRPRKTELLESSTLVYTRTEYDAKGRVWKTWNPTRCDPDLNSASCTGETTFGITETQYDGLDCGKSDSS